MELNKRQVGRAAGGVAIWYILIRIRLALDHYKCRDACTDAIRTVIIVSKINVADATTPQVANPNATSAALGEVVIILVSAVCIISPFVSGFNAVCLGLMDK